MDRQIPLTRPHHDDMEQTYVVDALSALGKGSNPGYVRACQEAVADQCGGRASLLTQSCTAALEMAAMLCGLEPGDEVILPSYTFVSTANAVVLRGAVPVFVDVRPDTLNIDETKVERAVTDRTRAIFAVHYAGVPAEMDTLVEIAGRHRLWLVEDAAQAYGSTYKGRPAGSLGDIACFSFHYTKNVVSGEGGAITVDQGADVARAEVLLEKGTNRRAFLQGRTDKYTWSDIGSSFQPSELTAAYLLAQLRRADAINQARRTAWQRYDAGFRALEGRVPGLQAPSVPDHCGHNGHIFYLLLPSAQQRQQLMTFLADNGITAAFHYVPLHSSPAGRRFGRTDGPLSVTDDIAGRLVRLPLFPGVADQVDTVIERVHAFFQAETS